MQLNRIFLIQKMIQRARICSYNIYTILFIYFVPIYKYMRKIVFLNIYSQIFIFEKCKKLFNKHFFL